MTRHVNINSKRRVTFLDAKTHARPKSFGKKTMVCIDFLDQLCVSRQHQTSTEWIVVLPASHPGLDHNPKHVISSNIARLNALKRLDICCDIESLPESLAKCGNLHKIVMLNNDPEQVMSSSLALALEKCTFITSIGDSSVSRYKSEQILK